MGIRDEHRLDDAGPVRDFGWVGRSHLSDGSPRPIGSHFDGTIKLAPSPLAARSSVGGKNLLQSETCIQRESFRIAADQLFPTSE
jgi:hypothetical protein